MRALPLTAKLYLLGVYLTSLIALAGACLAPALPVRAQPWELCLFLALGVLTGGKKISLAYNKGTDDVTMSLGFTVTFAALLQFGPTGGVLVGAASSLSASLYPRRLPLYRTLFNVGLVTLVAWSVGCLFLTLNGGTLRLRPLPTFYAITIASLVFFALNTGGMALVIALSRRQCVFSLWRQKFLWTAPSYLAGACVSTLIMLLGGRNSGAILLFLSPVAYLTYHSYAVRAAEKQSYIADLQKSRSDLADLHLATIKSLALAIDSKDQYTYQHILRVQRYAMATAHHLGLTGLELEGLNTGALLHDIGKLGVPEYVLLKPGRLTEEEFEKIKKHPEIGAAILDPVEFPWPVLPVVKSHHEKWDGTGYPEGLKGEAIPLTARILAVADVYDALTSARPYRKAWSCEQALEVIRRDSGHHFDPAIASAFLQVIDKVVAEMAAEEPAWPVAPLAVASPIIEKFDQAARDIHRASSELWALYEVSQTLSSSLGLTDTLDILARKLETILPETACLFLLRDEAGEGMTAQAAVGLNREFLLGARTVGRGGLSLAVAAQRHSYRGEYDTDDLMPIAATAAQWTPLQSALIVPLVDQDTVLGTINLYRPAPAAFGPHDQQLLESIAGRVAMTLHGALLFDRARSQALTDPLTGLSNLRHLTHVVQERCRQSRQIGEAAPPFALLCLDLDGFKPINDNFGHQRGDQVLRDLARLYRAGVRERDLVARYGSDEFLIVLNNAGPEEAAAMARRLQTAVEGYDPGLIHDTLGALHLGVSTGYACFPRDGRDCNALISIADARMYHDKMERKLGRMVDRPTSPCTTDPTIFLAA